ncbi:MAG: methionyl-tRNA formyltransferase [Alloprevotella sp.]|nr:methionyl-tRNA formyltransferase [Alloprevotella sp.]
MDKKELRIVYMGTPDFAVAALDKLVSGGYNVVGVVTMPDKPVGRHQNTLQASPVKQYALQKGLPVLQPEKLKDETFLAALDALQPDLQIVVAFRMLPEVVWNRPRLGTFNLHAALLPQYRGAAPINWAVINGDTETGVTTFFLDHNIDTGRVIRRVPVPISDTDTAGDVHDRLMEIGADVVAETVDMILAGNVQAIPQEEMMTDEPLRPAPKIFKETCRLDPALGVKRAYDFVRGLSPYPAAWLEASIGGKPLAIKLFRTEKEFTAHAYAPGTLVTDGHKVLKLALSDGFLIIRDLQPAGKKRMPAENWLNGLHLAESQEKDAQGLFTLG